MKKTVPSAKVTIISSCKCRELRLEVSRMLWLRPSICRLRGTRRTHFSPDSTHLANKTDDLPLFIQHPLRPFRNPSSPAFSPLGRKAAKFRNSCVIHSVLAEQICVTRCFAETAPIVIHRAFQVSQMKWWRTALFSTASPPRICVPSHGASPDTASNLRRP